jgi:hypothetical protein
LIKSLFSLQYTPYDEIAALRIHSFCDDVMINVCNKLGIEVPVYQLKRRIHITSKSDSSSFEIFGSSLNQRHSFMTRVEVFDHKHHRYYNLDEEPFTLPRDFITGDSGIDENDTIQLRLHF